MTRDKPFESVVADMDGVLTRTATVHERAWKQAFDELLARHAVRTGRDLEAFTGADYRAHVDGKPRYDGARDFLASRRIELPFGSPSDAPTSETVCGLANRKNQLFLELLDSTGVHVFEDTVAALARWRRGGMKLAIVSSSRNCRQVLEAVGLTRQVDAIVDGQLASELGLDGKREIMLEASRRLAIDPSDAVVLEDATAGVRAARQAGFGHVIGVSRNAHDQNLRDAGAHDVVHDVFRARFVRRIPAALERLDELSRWRGDRGLAVFLDFDGTLAPIVDNPKDASMPADTRAVLQTLATRCPVAIISGRDRADVTPRIGIEGLLYAGSHGIDIAGRGREKTLPEAAEALPDVQLAEDELRRHLGRLHGVIIERKRFSIAVHYRMVDSDCAIDQVARTVEAVRARTSLRTRIGKKVLELEPAVDWDKGRAARWLMDALHIDPAEVFTLYIGDDETDEDAFAALRGDGAGIRVGAEHSNSLADYRLADTDEVRALLEWLSARAAGGG